MFKLCGSRVLLVLCLACAASVISAAPPEVAPPPREATRGGVARENEEAYRRLDAAIREKLKKIPAKPQDELAYFLSFMFGKESEPKPPLFPAMRWTLRFNITSGKDYVKQLGVLGVSLVIPIPDDGKKVLYIPDMKKPDTRKELTEKDIGEVGPGLRFADSRKYVVPEVAAALGLDYKPAVFFAVLPKEVEEELARKETAYRNRKVEDIEETVFRVRVRGDKYEIVVEEQKVKR